MTIKDYRDNLLCDYSDERYFRLYHDLKKINNDSIDGFEIVTVEKDDLSIIVNIVNKSCINMKASCEQFENYTKTPAYNSDLWIMIKDISNNNYIACGIADFDNEAKELILEWIQVLPEYRRKGVGQLVVNELLNRGKSIANFATVSGKVDNVTKPELLYRKCGFTGDDVRHALCKNI